MPEQSCENPFSTRRVRPGAIAYEYAAPAGRQAALARFETAGRRGQIVGRMGREIRLLADLVRCWKQAGERVLLSELHDGQRRLPAASGRTRRERRRSWPSTVTNSWASGASAVCGVSAAVRDRLVVTCTSRWVYPTWPDAPFLETVERLARGLLGGETRGLRTK